ncbi:His/Gly/Thr/Pro-type tRNA ligase C-terminal domain-containing protein [Dongia sp.]|uniref:His/Gly/Thr/Pro-type tRNA ligase C-terminal domain-containing protein n=1 Tax=Dongia sp. TaxID=1977262 RepID=UPI0035AF3EC1
MDAFDHRSIGQRLDLFHFEEEQPGAVSWHPKGRMLRRQIEDCIRRRMKAAGFEAPRNPACTVGRDDAHLLCRMDQVAAEVKRFSQLLRAVYRDFGFADFAVGLSTRPKERAGSEEIWDAAERVLQGAARVAGLDYALQPGEGAPCGPKLEFILQDRLRRRWRCGTIQLDFVLPERPGTHYSDEDGAGAVPVVIRHAVLGSMERFIGMLLEHWQGRLPLWLAPEQVLVAAVSDRFFGYAEEAAIQLEADGFRVAIDAGNETLADKIVGWRARGIPILAVVGAREAEKARVNLRTLVDDVRAELPLREAAGWIKRVAARSGAAATMPP